MSVARNHRESADEEIVDFLSGADNYTIIIFDTETNGLPPPRSPVCPSTLSISAIKAVIRSKEELEPVAIYNRYYYPREDYDQGAIGINGLTEHVIDGKRAESIKQYQVYFDQDYEDFQEFCSGVKLFVGHNAQDFDTQFVPCIDWKTVKIFDTMHANTDVVCARWESRGHYDHGIWSDKPGWKAPRLIEAAEFYKIKFEDTELHGSLYDATITSKVFMEMLKRSPVRLKRFEES